MPLPVGYLTASNRYIIWHFDRFIARQWPLFNAGILLILQNLDQMVFGSQISKGQKTNSNIFFKVRIFELRLTSLPGINNGGSYCYCYYYQKMTKSWTERLNIMLQLH